MSLIINLKTMSITIKDTYSYKGWIISDSFIKRSFASLGYQIMGTLFVYAIFLVIAAVVGILAWIISLIF